MQRNMSGFYAVDFRQKQDIHCTLASAPAVTGSVIMWRSRLVLGQCTEELTIFQAAYSLSISLTVVLYEMLPKNPTLQYIKLIQQYIKFNGKKKLLLI